MTSSELFSFPISTHSNVPANLPPSKNPKPKPPKIPTHRRRNMEPHRPIAGRILQRKPLGDCTNTSSSLKFANPILTSSLKRLVDQTSLKENHDEDDSFTASKPLSTTLRPVTRRVSADLCFPGQNSRFDVGVGGGDKEVAEPYSVYTVRRRKAASVRIRSHDAASSSAVASLRLDPGKKRRQANENTVKPSSVAPFKKQRTANHEEDNLASGVSQDYIEKQRAYFAEVDAFELAEEEVSESDLD